MGVSYTPSQDEIKQSWDQYTEFTQSPQGKKYSGMYSGPGSTGANFSGFDPVSYQNDLKTWLDAKAAGSTAAKNYTTLAGSLPGRDATILTGPAATILGRNS